MKYHSNKWLDALAWIYIAVVIFWFMTYLVFRDRFGLIASLNTFAIYLFFPLPIFIVLVVITHQRKIWSGLGIIGIIFFVLWGGLFIPKQRGAFAHQYEGLNLSVMTYNLLGWQSNTSAQIEVIRLENPDVVMMQELNPDMAQAIEQELMDVFPYQVLLPKTDVSGMGVISKYPLAPTGLTIDGKNWVGDPQILNLDWQGKQVTLVNIHMWPTTGMNTRSIELTSRIRQAQAQVVVDFIQGCTPVIVAGDTNTSPLNETYRIFTAHLKDPWKEAGFGFGHTFPGSAVPGSSRPVIFGILSPQWLVRIDYVFHSVEWQAISARTAHFDGVSDHRGVVVELAWVE